MVWAMLLWLRGVAFTVLVPAVVGLYVPSIFLEGRRLQAGAWQAGWILVIVGTATYLVCLIQFLAAGGTPAIFFTRHLRFLIGEEPTVVVRQGIYRISRNPMYVGVLTAIFGQAILYRSRAVAIYGLTAWVFFHLVVVFLEEPHLRATRGDEYARYCRQSPRWLGWARP
jgi:protein-S-isoprenylcysteine O-methyltransferase Ste14